LGADGDFYIDTASNYLYGPKTGGAWGAGVSIVGPQGLAGTTGPQGPTGPTGPQGLDGDDGKTLRHGAGAPDPGLGVDGDFYIDTSVKNLYGPKTGGSWGSGASIVGPAGATGAAGPTGATGATGATGPAGTNGTNGTNGFSVLNGAGAPAGGTGVNGDFYINTSTWDIYGPKAGGAWGSPTSLIGGLDAEGVRDTVATFCVAGSNMTITHDDGANTLTFTSTGGPGGA
jgi:hypothetical protein